MRFFRFGENGEVLAIALPSSVQKAASVREDQEYEFVELGEGAILLVSRSRMAQLAKASLLGKFGEKLLEIPAPTQTSQTATPARPATVQTPRPQQVPTPRPEQSYSNEGPIPAAAMAPSIPAAVVEKTLEKDGFMVVDEEGAKAVSSAVEQQIKQGTVAGVRGFDKRYYIVSRWFYDKMAEKIRVAAAGKEAQASEIASAVHTSEDATLAVLQVMKEKGDALEKRRGMFRVV
jgi:hypothetical protein